MEAKVTGRQKRIAMYLIVVIVAALIAYFGGLWIKRLRPGRTIADSERVATEPPPLTKPLENSGFRRLVV